MQSVIALVGRLFLSVIFILSGVSKIGAYTATVGYMEKAGIPAAPFFLYAAVLIELGAGLSLATGYRARYGALVLALFLIPLTYIFHFHPAYDVNWNVVDRIQLLNAMKNLAIIGGLLLVYGNGAGSLTIGKDA